MKLVIGNKNYSSWSLRPWLLLSFHNIPFEEERIPLDKSDTQDRIAACSDAGKVPVLLDDELIVWDSLAICEYVSECYLGGAGWPESASVRAEARACSAEMHSGFPEIRNRMPMNCRAMGRRVELTDALRREIARIDRIWSGYRQRYATAGPWLFGEFSIADCMFAPVVFRFRTYGIGLSQQAAGYMQHLLGADALRQWMMQAEAELETIEAEEVGR
ncbi:glutathione S-transferase family protein [Marinobacterium rhizophilum]|uniref:Glutathione S-transferase family protein n=1 Tax=Marinobacterium rhizophilum TaxID=420402 RepID=A0ABY5HRR5_9GAMM|nr:glutathione S-transferase family protein [Marinobacterium rhizophilum]UTW13865.1 glutathione S-transferase family protein [Marinobacterium rhizophilum]